MDEVLAFWFADQARWWRKDPAFDAEVRTRFSELHAAVDRGAHEDWRSTARGSLAYVVVLDQFSRNMFRDTPRMFASDARALVATLAALAAGHDDALTPAERGMLYMPLMHSEDLAHQEECVARFRAFSRPEQLIFAEKHRDIIARFGRFPHRNALLGRASTAEEQAFLLEPGSSF